MRVIAKRTLREFWERHPGNTAAKAPLQDWHAQASAADWGTPADLKAQFGDAPILRGGRVVFNIGGNKYRLVARFIYADPGARPPLNGIALVAFIGTHQAYDRIDVTAL